MPGQAEQGWPRSAAARDTVIVGADGRIPVVLGDPGPARRVGVGRAAHRFREMLAHFDCRNRPVGFRLSPAQARPGQASCGQSHASNLRYLPGIRDARLPNALRVADVAVFEHKTVSTPHLEACFREERYADRVSKVVSDLQGTLFLHNSSGHNNIT